MAWTDFIMVYVNRGPGDIAPVRAIRKDKENITHSVERIFESVIIIPHNKKYEKMCQENPCFPLHFCIY